MKYSTGIMLCALLLAGCGKGNDNKPMLEQERATLNKAKQLDGLQQQQAQQQKQEEEKQAQ